MAASSSCTLSYNQQIICALSILFVLYIRADSQQQQQQGAPVARDPRVKPSIVPNLPAHHYQFWLRSNLRAFQVYKHICSQVNPLDPMSLIFESLHANLSLEDSRYLADLDYGKSVLNRICSKINDVTKSCWGYENNCDIIYLMPECYGSSLGMVNDKQKQKATWYTQADFGYILERRRELSKFCSPDKDFSNSSKSSLECAKNFKTCRGNDLMLKFKASPMNLTRDGPNSSLIGKGDVGGWNCDLQLKRIKEEGGQEGHLQSWFTELKNYNRMSSGETCDITIEKRAFLIKLDYPSNIYHYFCNFLNLYATMHLYNKFSDDNQIIIWDNQLPQSNFEKMWSVFSKNPLMSIEEFRGKRVCFKKFIFTLLPRMTEGLYYNAHLILGCSKSGLFDAFNKHVLHRLNIVQYYNLDFYRKDENKFIRITMIKRSTPHRRILNEIELQEAIRNRSSEYDVSLVDYSEKSFEDQLNISMNTDILVGMHGAGLTHTLFLPDWAAVFEVHDCDDRCYRDLARLRGVNYFSYRRVDKDKFLKKFPVSDQKEFMKLNQTKWADHDKFSDYKIDIPEFLKVIERAVEKVKKIRVKYFEDIEKNLKPKADDKTAGVKEKTKTKDSVSNQRSEL